MSQRRMTSLDVIDTDAFLDMSQGSQLLYFHLNARADDDGFVANPKRVMRDIGSQLDDLRLLVAKKFLISFDDGVVVVKHWRINNYIRKDIYKETKYLDLKRTLLIRPNGAYTLTDDGQAVPVPAGHFQLEDIKPKNGLPEPQNNVHEPSTTRALSIGKVRLGKDRINNTAPAKAVTEQNKEIQECIYLFRILNPNYKSLFANKTQRSDAEFLLATFGTKDVERNVYLAKFCFTDKFFPNFTTPHELRLKWPKVVKFWATHQTDKRFVSEFMKFWEEQTKPKEQKVVVSKTISGVKFDYGTAA